MPRRGKRIRHEDGFSKGHDESTSSSNGLTSPELVEAPTADYAADTHLLTHLQHPTAQSLRLKAVQRLARMGNHATGQTLLQRQPAPGAGSGSAAPAVTPAADPAQRQKDMDAFLAKGVLPNATGQDVIGASGRGGFNARWDPAERALMATVNVGFKFTNGMTLDPAGRFVANTADLNATNDSTQIAQLQTLAAKINASKTKAQRATMIGDWQWGADKAAWMTTYQQQVISAWSGQHFFTAKRFPELHASVRLNVNVHENAAPGDHTQAVIVKLPDDIEMGAAVNRGSNTDPHDQRLRMGSTGNRRSKTNFLHYSLRFPTGKSDVASAVGTEHSKDPGPTYLNKFIADSAAGYADAGVGIEVVGHASATGDPTGNQTLSDTRATNVANYIRSNGLTGAATRVTSHGDGQIGATKDRAWQRVDIIVGSGESQLTTSHEFGHMIGLLDEYSSPTGGFYPGAGSPIPAGTAAGHDAMAKAMGGGVRGAVAENSDNIMSVGNTVQPQHYATFHNALQTVTGEQWEYGGSSRGIPLPATGGPNANPPAGTAIA